MLRIDRLFLDPEAYRLDCRVVMLALQRGWLSDLSLSAIEALRARFLRLRSAWPADDVRSNRLDDRLRELIMALTLLDRTPANPDQPLPQPEQAERPCQTLEAGLVRKEAIKSGDPRSVRGVEVRIGERVERVPVVMYLDTRWRCWRARLICPGCGTRRRKLVPTQSGVRCRDCLGRRLRAIAGRSW